MSDTNADSLLARRIAEAAGKLLLTLRDSGMFSGKALGDAGDQIANAMILRALAQERPGEAVLSEESADCSDRLNCSRVWIVDPLDGTREYSEGRDDWAVHIALAIDGQPAVGAVALPEMGITLATDTPPALPRTNDPVRMVVSRTRPAPEAVAIAEQTGAELVPMGSAGAKAMAVVRGEADIYLHSGGQYEWDSCAPIAVARAAGLHVSRIDGSPMVYNMAEVWLPDLLICRKEAAPALLASVRDFAQGAR
ncbi:3'(2'),5'-bisphosphate nucleotidase CysQ [Stakelama pacifica]|uniref:3'(2'),5-bisphosphonucleoside 3'(2')-phosphohydrolase n=1 Tax=Stakelama pacifica TaxID=517720 RepID=A0A4R6FII4_9SPHN|nr:3'(2'),5'-bisphosphate nucleotidase CysQ [Stakelama pacifica]TDN81196.1 3'(2'),5'-bisphosphate nucleotidase [Stakelama pacifica]GGO97037.1 3'(2'),5'-bisphosphate nucleotidase CysQ [Stakelama pacifica]